MGRYGGTGYVVAGLLASTPAVVYDINTHAYRNMATEAVEAVQGLGEEDGPDPRDALPHALQGFTQTEGNERIARVIQYIDAGASKDRVISQASAGGAVMLAIDMMVSSLIVLDEADSESGAKYITDVNEEGEDVGLDRSEIQFIPRAPDSDENDGLDNGRCSLEPEDPRSRGCEDFVRLDSGVFSWPGLGADRNGNVAYKYKLINWLFAKDTRCLWDQLIIPGLNEVLQTEYGETIDGPDMHSDAASFVIRATVREQRAIEGIVSPQQILININEATKYDPGERLSDQFQIQENENPENIRAPEIQDDWCVKDLDGNILVEIVRDKIALWAHLGQPVVKPYFNHHLMKVDEGNENYAPLDPEVVEAVLRGSA